MWNLMAYPYVFTFARALTTPVLPEFVNDKRIHRSGAGVIRHVNDPAVPPAACVELVYISQWLKPVTVPSGSIAPTSFEVSTIKLPAGVPLQTAWIEHIVWKSKKIGVEWIVPVIVTAVKIGKLASNISSP